MRHFFVSVGLGLFLSTVGRNPAGISEAVTMSLKAVAVNGVPCAECPTDNIKASPGDQITVEIKVREWGPDCMWGYQAKIDSTSRRPKTLSPETRETVAPGSSWRASSSVMGRTIGIVQAHSSPPRSIAPRARTER